MKETAGRDMFALAQECLAKMAAQGTNPFSFGTIMEPWISDFVDVPTIHATATREIQTLIRKVKVEGRSKARLLIGDSANGKSHVLARIKNNFSDQAFFCFVEPLTGDGDNIFRHVLANVARDLFRKVPSANHPQFHRVWRDFFLGVASNRNDHHENFLAWTENRKHDFIWLIDNQLKASGKRIRPEIIGVLYEYARNYRTDRRIRLVVENWLGAGILNEEELEIIDCFPSKQCIDSEDKAKDVIKALGIVTSFSRPVFLCFDQVEAYILNDKAFRSFMKSVEYIREYTYNYAIVTSALLTFDEKLRTSGLTPSTWDRFNYTNKPILIHPLNPAEGEKLLAARLEHEMGRTEVLFRRPLFPFSAQDVDEILTPAGAATKTHKQARYILADAERIFDEIVSRKPSAWDIRRYLNGDAPLRGPAVTREPDRHWPKPEDIWTYLTQKMEAAYLYYRLNPDKVGVDQSRNREIVLDLLFKATNRVSRQNYLDIDNLVVNRARGPRSCDFSFTIHGRESSTRQIGVLFCDDPRANVIRSLVRKASTALQSTSIERLVYAKDSRVNLTAKSRALLQDFQMQFSDSPGRVIVSSINGKTLQHLRAMRRLFELAGSGDLTMHNSAMKKDYRITDDNVTDYLLINNCLLVNGLILTIISGRDHCGSA